MSIPHYIEQGPMSRFQVVAVVLCMIINMMDGFDALVIAFTAPSIAAEWGLTPATVGLLLSAGLTGMVLGSLFIGPLADRIGRRKLILSCLVAMTIGMLLSGFCQGAPQLAAMRLFTGLGIGGILPGLNTIVAEYSSLRWRSFSVSLMQTGYPIGATLGGILTALLIVKYGWRSTFFLGAFASATMIPLVWKYLPESLDYLLVRRPQDALVRINGLLARMGKPLIAALPPVSPGVGGVQVKRSSVYAPLFSNPTLFSRTIFLTAAFFTLMTSFFFVTTWTPKILVDSGLSTTQGISGGVVLNLGGIAGSLVLGYLSSRLPLIRLTIIYVLTAGILMTVFAQTVEPIGLMILVAASLGFFLFGSMIGLYAMAPDLFPPANRAAGVGVAIGVGRIGGMVAPLLAGLLFEYGMQQRLGYIVFTVPLVVTVVVVVLLGRLRRSA